MFAAVAICATPARAQAPGCGDAEILASQGEAMVAAAQRHVEAADLNGDHLLDLVVSMGHSLVIAMATGTTGSKVNYSAAYSLPTGLDPTGTAIADFNGDGINDIAVACDGGGVQLFRGLGADGVGNGQFVLYQTFDVGSAWDIASADINGDGIRDLVVALRGGAVLPFLGNGSGGVGDGTFTQGVTAAAAGSPKGLALGDFNKDGILDAVVATEGASVDVLIGGGSGGVGNGTFGVALTLAGAGTTYDVTIGDFNGDTWPDIASADYTNHSVSVFLGGPGLVFQPVITHSALGSPLGIEAADFDGDGHVDIVAAATGSGSSFVYFHNSGTTTPSPDGFFASTSYGPGRVGYGISTADLNGDHGFDVMVPGISETTVLLAFNACVADQPRILTTNVIGSGTIVRDPDLPSYTTGTVVQLTAIPAADWVFSNWSGDALGSANPISVTMNYDRTVTARFIPLQRTLTVAFSGPGHGTVLRSPDLPTYDNGSTVRLTAVPDFGSVFAGWSGDATGDTNPVDLVMSSDKSVTAAFEIDHSIAPRILSVTDVPLDQGGKVKLRWRSSSLESTTTSPDTLVTQYFIWREIPQSAFRAATAGATLFMRTATATREYFWEFVTSLPASRFTGYSYTASTTNDSTEHGNPYTAFLVQARNAAGTRWFDSDPDSGYSVDNLSPTTPGPVVANYGAAVNTLHWGPSHAPDLRAYRIHGGTTRDFVPSDANLIAEVSDTSYVDPAPRPLYYRLAAVDIHGNLSHYVLVSPESPVSTLVSVVTAQGAADRISLVWYVSQPALPAVVYRRTQASPWGAIAQAFADGSGFLRFEDDAVTRGERYGYRLGIQDGGVEAFFGETTVLAEDLRFALDGVVPNPSTGERLTVTFALPSADRATLELLDVTGRRLAGQRIEGAVGRQTVTLDAGRRLAPGLYWIRLRHAGQEKTTRAVVMQ